MITQETINYNRIAEAIDYIKQNFKEQPNLDEVAEKIHLSPHHFQRLFTDWAGVGAAEIGVDGGVSKIK